MERSSHGSVRTGQTFEFVAVCGVTSANISGFKGAEENIVQVRRDNKSWRRCWSAAHT